MLRNKRLSSGVALLVCAFLCLVVGAAEKTTVTQKLPSAQASLQEKLNQRVDFEVVEMPLKDVCSMLNRNFGLQVLLQLKKLEEASVSADTPVTKAFSQVRLSTILELMLKDLELTYIEKDGLLLITTPEDEESTLQIRVYDCRDLLAMPEPQVPDPPARPTATNPATTTPTSGATAGAGASGAAAAAAVAGVMGRSQQAKAPQSELERRSDQLIELITSSVAADSWDDVGGPGSITTYNGLFVVAQTRRPHEQVEHLLDMLRQAAGLDAKLARVIR